MSRPESGVKSATGLSAQVKAVSQAEGSPRDPPSKITFGMASKRVRRLANGKAGAMPHELIAAWWRGEAGNGVDGTTETEKQ